MVDPGEAQVIAQMNQYALQDRLLVEVHSALSQRPQPKLTLFAPCVGNRYDGELMVIGRAVNGWDAGDFDLADMRTPEGRAAISGAPTWDGCPLRWVSDHWGVNEEDVYNPAKSAFWRVIKRVTAGIGIDGDDWSSYLAWTNLYKVAPAAGGNPGGRLCRVQRPACIDLLQWELKTCKPKRVLVLTGWNWFGEMAEGLGFEAEATTDGELVEAMGRIGDARVVVAKHPQGKPGAEMVDQIMKGWR